MRDLPRRRRPRLERPESDDALFHPAAATSACWQIIRNGVPGSIMPPSRNTDDGAARDLGYLKVLGTPPPSSAAYVRPAANADLVTLTTNDGTQIYGERKNEDAFSIQILEAGGRLQGYSKSAIKTITRGERAPSAPAATWPGVDLPATFSPA